MPLTTTIWLQQKDHFWSRTAYYASLGYDRLAAAVLRPRRGGAARRPRPGRRHGHGHHRARTRRPRPGRDHRRHECARPGGGGVAHRRAGAVARRIRFMVTSAAALPFPDGHFGAAVASTCCITSRTGAPRSRSWRASSGREARWCSPTSRAEGFELVRRVHALGGPRAPGGPGHDGLGPGVPVRRPGPGRGEGVDRPVAPGQRAAGAGRRPGVAGVRLARSDGPAAGAGGVREQLAGPRRVLVPRGGGALRHGDGHGSRRRLVAAVRGRRGPAHHVRVRHPARRRSRVAPAGPRLPDVQLHQPVADRGLGRRARSEVLHGVLPRAGHPASQRPPRLPLQARGPGRVRNVRPHRWTPVSGRPACTALPTPRPAATAGGSSALSTGEPLPGAAAQEQ